MRVLIATNDLQGTEPGDYAHTVEGELVTPVFDVPCAAPRDACGCGRAFPGLASAKATTTAMIVERDFIDEADLRDVLLGWLERTGWVDLLAEHSDDPDREINEIIDEHVEVIDEICHSFPVGTVVERCATLISSRSYRTAA